MNIALTERFERDVRALPAERRAGVLECILSLLRAIGEPHLHAGLGVRKLHISGIWETRIGLVFALEKDAVTLVRAGTHDAIRRYLREL